MLSTIQTWDLWGQAWLGLQPLLCLILLTALVSVIVSTPKEPTGEIFGVTLVFGALGLALGLFSGLSDLGATTGALAGAAAVIFGFVAVILRNREPSSTERIQGFATLLARPMEAQNDKGEMRQATDDKGIPLKEMSPLKVCVGTILLLFSLIFGMFWGQGIASIRAAELTRATADAAETAAAAQAAREADKARLDADLAEAAAIAEAQRAADKARLDAALKASPPPAE